MSARSAPLDRLGLDRRGLGLALALAAIASQLVLPPGTPVAVGSYLATAALAAGYAVAAVSRRDRPDLRPWRLVSGVIVVTLGLGVVRLTAPLGPNAGGLAMLLDGLFLVPYGLLVVALIQLIRGQAARHDWATLFDAAIVALGLGLGSFFLATAVAGPPGGIAQEQLATVASTYAIGIPSTVLATWLALAGGPPRGAVACLYAAVVAQALGDAGLAIELANPAVRAPSDAAWLAALVLLAAAAGRAAAAGPEAARSPLIRDPARLWLLALAVGAPALDSFVAAVADQPAAHVSLLVVTVSGLAILRIAYLLRQVGRLSADTDAYRDLTARLEHARGEYQSLVDASPGTSWTSSIIDPATGETGRLFVSPQIEELTGYPASEFQSGARRWRDMMHPDDRAVVADRYQARVRDWAAGRLPAGLAEVDEYRIISRDGRVKWVRDTQRLEPDPGGSHGTIHGLVLDITEQREVEEEVRASEARFRVLVEQLPGVVFLREVDGDRPGRMLYVSPSAERITGWSAEHILADEFHWPELYEREDVPVMLGARTRHFATQGRETVRVRIARRPGRPDIARHVEVTWVKAGDLADGRWLSLGVVLDITAIHELQADLEQLNADLEGRIVERTAELRAAQLEAERASRAKSEFLSSVSHELRTPLNAILGFGQLLQLSPLAPPDEESATEIVRAGRQLLGMIEEVLEFSRLDAGRITLSIEPVELAPLVRETFDLCRPGAAERGVTLVDGIDDGAGLAVLGDRRRLGQVLLSLMSNAIRFNVQDGRVTVTTEADADQVVVRIADTGVGIEADRLARLFEPFEALRGDRSSSHSLGLGLPLSARLAELMGGDLRVSSSVGVGSTFELRLPRVSLAQVPAASGSESPASPTVATAVLYIEDNLSNLALVERILARRFGVRVLAAIQGRLGLELAREHRPSLILLDMHLPDTEPDDLLGELAADERTAAIPVIVLSSDVSPGRRDAMLALGAADYLTKPLDIDRFVQVVDARLGQR